MNELYQLETVRLVSTVTEIQTKDIHSPASYKDFMSSLFDDDVFNVANIFVLFGSGNP